MKANTYLVLYCRGSTADDANRILLSKGLMLRILVTFILSQAIFVSYLLCY